MRLNFECGRAWQSRLGLLALLPVALLSGCLEDEKTGVSYDGANHTDRPAMFVTINGEGGIMNIEPGAEGGDICCVIVPVKWKPGLKVTVGWQDEGSWLKDEQGNEVIRNGKTVLIPAPRKSKTVDLPEYDTPETLWIHFFPNEEVKVVMSKYGPGSVKHPIPNPEQAAWARRDAEFEKAEQQQKNGMQKP